jgi:hypothetical protein
MGIRPMRRLSKFSVISGLVALAIAFAGIVAAGSDSVAQGGKKSEGSSDGLSKPHVGF